MPSSHPTLSLGLHVMKERKLKPKLPEELDHKLKLLKSKNPLGITVQCRVDAANLLNEIKTLLDRSGGVLTPAHAPLIHSRIKGWWAKETKRKTPSIHYSDSTVAGIASILLSALHLFLKSLSRDSIKSRGEDFQRLSKFVQECVDILVGISRRSDTVFCWRHVSMFLDSVRSKTEVEVAGLLPAEVLQEDIQSLRIGIVQALEAALREGNVEEAERTFTSIGGHSAIKVVALEVLNRLLRGDAARLPFRSQDWLLTTLGISLGESTIQYANPGESPETRQAAALVLFLWDHVKEGQEIREAFERFRSLCERHFRLFLRGEVGAIMQFDNRIHESTVALSGQVKLMRPWVEWFNPPQAYVVIRGLVCEAPT